MYNEEVGPDPAAASQALRCVCMYVLICARMYFLNVYTCTYACVLRGMCDVCVCMYMYAHMYVLHLFYVMARKEYKERYCVYVYMYIYIHTHLYIHTYTHYAETWLTATRSES
jgi:hypothetical protein